MTSIIKNGLVVTSDFKGFEKKDIFIENGLITNEIKDKSAVRIFDAREKFVLPGLIDIHNHGALGISYSDTEKSFYPPLRFCAESGITSVVATLYVNSISNLSAQIENIVSSNNAYKSCSKIVGIHVEGPFLSPKKAGAMRLCSDEYTVENFNKLIDTGKGFIKIVTIAPECDGAEEMIKSGKARGIRMSLGHTDATYEEAMAAIRAGATGSTHTFNAMRPLSHRDPGVIGAILTDTRVSCEIICDKIHISEPIIKLIYAAKGSDNVIIVSDNIAPAGLPDGEYTVDGILNTVKDGACTVNNGKTIAGSIQSQSAGAKNLVKLGIPLNEVSKMCSYNPACAIGLENEIGSIKSGNSADIIITDENFNVEHTFISGIQLK